MKKLLILIFLLFYSIGYCQITWSEWYAEDSIVSNQKRYNNDTTLFLENVFINGKLNRLEYYDNGALKIKAHIRQESFDTIWYPITMELDTYYLETHFSDKENGKYIEYYLNGNIKKCGNYRSGLVGKWKHYWENSEIQLIIDWDKNGYMKNNSEYSSSGRLEKKGRYIRLGKEEYKIGVWRYFLANGKLDKKVIHKKPSKAIIPKNEQTLKSLKGHH